MVSSFGIIASIPPSCCQVKESDGCLSCGKPLRSTPTMKPAEGNTAANSKTLDTQYKHTFDFETLVLFRPLAPDPFFSSRWWWVAGAVEKRRRMPSLIAAAVLSCLHRSVPTEKSNIRGATFRLGMVEIHQ